MRFRKIFFKSLLPILLILSFGCASTPRQPVVPEKEKIKRDNLFGFQLAEKFENQLRIRNELEASIYLRSMAELLTKADRNLNESPVGVFLFSERQSESYRNYALPGNRIYLSVGGIKATEYEAEMAAAIALELAHVKKRHVLARLEKEQSDDTMERGESFVPRNNIIFLGPGGVFAFSLEENLAAVEEGISLLYAAGVDPRGMLALLKRYGAEPLKSPFDSRTIELLLEKAQEVYAFYAPLKNPIMNSARFAEIKKRIQKL